MRRGILLLVAILLCGGAQALNPSGSPAVGFAGGAYDWHVHALQRGLATRADACAPTGNVVSLYATTLAFGARAYTGAPNRCVSLPYVIPASDVYAPGSFAGNATATDQNGKVGVGPGIIRIAFLPDNAGEVAGFPDLAPYPAPKPNAHVRLQFLVSAAGSVRAASYTWDGITHYDTLWLTTRQTGDILVEDSFVWPEGRATTMFDGAPKYIGDLRHGGLQWWQMVPVEDVGVPGGTV